MKMFVQNNPEAAAKQVNEWLTENKVAVCHITQSQCETQGRFVLIISVFYVKEQMVEHEKTSVLPRTAEPVKTKGNKHT